MDILDEKGVPYSPKDIVTRFIEASIMDGFESELERYPAITEKQKEIARKEYDKLIARIRRLS